MWSKPWDKSLWLLQSSWESGVGREGVLSDLLHVQKKKKKGITQRKGDGIPWGLPLAGVGPELLRGQSMRFQIPKRGRVGQRNQKVLTIKTVRKSGPPNSSFPSSPFLRKSPKNTQLSFPPLPGSGCITSDEPLGVSGAWTAHQVPGDLCVPRAGVY